MVSATCKLSEAITLAADAHRGQKRYGGEPFILHPLAVMFAVEELGETVMIAAVLHDVVEDTWMSLEEIQRKFGVQVADLVGYLTRKDGEYYFDYIRRVSENPTAAEIKCADIKHNWLTHPSMPDSLIERYNTALNILDEWVDD